jgi:cytochrome c5
MLKTRTLTGISILMIAFLIAACATSKKKSSTSTTTTTTTTTTASTEADADWAAKKWPGTTASDLEQGHTYYTASCGKCHKLMDPAKHDEAGWRNTMKSMQPKAKIDDNTAESIIHYLVAAGQKK